MTKTLTEQWREGTLPDGAYYILVDKYEQNEPEIDVGICYNSNFEWWIVKEVLAPVPSYDKVKEMVQKIHILNEQNTKQYNELCEEIKKNNILEKKLKIATKALKNAHKFPSTISLKEYCDKALKEMEGVK